MNALDLLGMGDHPAIELLNSTSDALGPHLDVLDSGDGLLAWLQATGLLDDVGAADVRNTMTAAKLDAAAARARGFREEMRSVVADWSAATPLPAPVVRRLNTLLEAESRHLVLMEDGGRLDTADRSVLGSADSLLALVAAAVADLVAHGEPELVRHCEGAGCTMWFYDRTKGHRRRWCSMAVCGNRAKAAAHRARQRFA